MRRSGRILFSVMTLILVAGQCLRGTCGAGAGRRAR